MNKHARQLLLVMIGCTLFLGVGVLKLIGWDVYKDGDVFNKIYPQTFICFLILPLIGIKKLFKLKSELRLMAALVALIVAQVAGSGIYGISNLINVLIYPVLLSGCLTYASQPTKLYIRSMVIVFYVVNCLTAIMERVVQENIIPFAASREDFQENATHAFRATALHNHPLSNALVTSVIMSFILFDKSMKETHKSLLMALGLGSYLAFDTRSTIALWGSLLALYFIYVVIAGKSLANKLKIIGCILVSIMVIVPLIQYAGFGSRFFSVSVDESDASTLERIRLWNLISSASYDDYLFGVSSDSATALYSQYGLRHIENAWVLFVVRYGIIGVAVVSYLYYKLLRKVSADRFTVFGVWFVLLLLILLSSINNSLANESQALAVLVICMHTFNIMPLPLGLRKRRASPNYVGMGRKRPALS